jgi:hypothetical protein
LNRAFAAPTGFLRHYRKHECNKNRGIPKAAAMLALAERRSTFSLKTRQKPPSPLAVLKSKFLRSFRSLGSITAAAADVGIKPQRRYSWMFIRSSRP